MKGQNPGAVQGEVTEKVKAQQLAHQNRLKSEAGQVMGPGGRPCICYGLKRNESGEWVGEHEGKPVLLTEDNGSHLFVGGVLTWLGACGDPMPFFEIHPGLVRSHIYELEA
jgi:hypothetical protein